MKAILYPIQAANPHRIAIVARPRGGDWLSDEIAAMSNQRIEVLVSMLTEKESQELGLDRESDECAATAIKFLNVPIPDRSVPPDKDDFVHAVQELAEIVRKGGFVGVHCRAGIGRSSVLAVSILIHLGWDAGAAFAVVASARGCAVSDTLEQRQWVIENVAAPPSSP